jgi:hypothetical protein
MKKYYCSFENGRMYIKELNETGQNNRCEYEKLRNTYNSVKLHNSIEECIKYLGSYTKITILPDGREIIPDAINYKNDLWYILKPVRFPIFETIAENL